MTTLDPQSIISAIRAATGVLPIAARNLGCTEDDILQAAQMEFRPPGRDSLCPSGASLVSTMPAPSGDPERVAARKKDFRFCVFHDIYYL